MEGWPGSVASQVGLCSPWLRPPCTVRPAPPLAPDEELEEQDVDTENQYYNSKGLLESEDWEEALAGFNQVLRMEGDEKGEW